MMSDNEDVLAAQQADHETEKREVSLLQALWQKGAALPVELAVRTFHFPEEIAQPLANLEQKGLVERQSLKTGEMIVLTQKGQEQAKIDSSILE